MGTTPDACDWFAIGARGNLKAVTSACELLAESSPPAFGIARPKPACQDVPPERLLSGDEVSRGGARTRPVTDVRE